MSIGAKWDSYNYRLVHRSKKRHRFIIRWTRCSAIALAERPRCRVRYSFRQVEDWNWETIFYWHYTVWVKKSSPPLKPFAIFSLMVNLYKWKIPWLLHKHIPRFTPILVHICMNCNIFTSKTPEILTIPLRTLRNSWIFR